MLCPSCGHENREDATFCGGCGAALAAELVCASCGRSNPPDQIFCDACGQRLTEAAKPDERPAPSEAPDSAERPELMETVPSEPVEARAYPVTFDVPPPLYFGWGQLILRILIFFATYFILLGAILQIDVVSIEIVIVFVGAYVALPVIAAYVTLPVIAAILISSKGAERYLAEAEEGPTKWLRYIMGICSYQALATDKLPIRAPEEVVELGVQPSGSPTVDSALQRIILAVPHVLVLGLLAIVFAIVWLIAAISIAFNHGTYPEWVSNLISGYLRWIARVLAYMASLVDEYPPFPVEPVGPESRSPWAAAHAEPAAERPEAARREPRETAPSKPVGVASADPAQGLPAARAEAPQEQSIASSSEAILALMRVDGRRLALTANGFAVDKRTPLEWAAWIPDVIGHAVGFVPLGKLLGLPFKGAADHIRNRITEARWAALAAGDLSEAYFISWNDVTAATVRFDRSGLRLRIDATERPAGRLPRRRVHEFKGIESGGVGRSLSILNRVIPERIVFPENREMFDREASKLCYVPADLFCENLCASGLEAELPPGEDWVVHIKHSNITRVAVSGEGFVCSLRDAPPVDWQENKIKRRKGEVVEWKGDERISQALSNDTFVNEVLVNEMEAKLVQNVHLHKAEDDLAHIEVTTERMPTSRLMEALGRIADHLHD